MKLLSLQSINNIPILFVGMTLAAVIKAVLLIISGIVIGKIVSRITSHALLKHTQYHSTLIRRVIFYGIFLLFLIAALQDLGFKMSVLLGAAGILTVALGFASQTSVSNVISGLFLIAEKPFVIGDYITVANATGEVLSVDLLSIKLRTYHNTLLRIPNEVLIKSNIINLTRFPIRRFDLQLGIAYKEDVEYVRKILLELANKNPLCLEEPKPMLYILGFGESAINLQFSVWATKQNFVDLSNTLQEEVKKAFDQNHIEMPFRQISISTASVTDSFPITVIDKKSDSLNS